MLEPSSAGRVEVVSGARADGTWRFNMKTTFAVLAFLLAATAAACNTVEGAGQDLSSAGQAIENSADNAKN